MANGYGTILKPGTGKNDTRSVSSFASVSYNYLERYTAEVTANASGSSQFGPITVLHLSGREVWMEC